MGIIQAWVGPSPVNNPNQIPDISLWYDATDGSAAQFGTAKTNGAVITTWVDLTGAGHDANKAGTSTVKPSWLANAQNGKGVVDFVSGESDSLDINPIAWAQNLSGATIYVVHKLDALTIERTITTTSANDFNIRTDSTNPVVEFAGGVGTATGIASDLNYHMVGAIFDGTQTGNANRLKMRYDGVQATLNFGATTVGTATDASASYMYLSRNAGGTVFTDGKIGTVMIFTRALSTAECLQVEGYLKNIWGL